MKTQTLLFAASFAAASAFGTVYNDAVGDLNDGTGGGSDLSGFTHLDIASVEITNDATNVMFSVNFVGDILATDWGKYLVGIDTVPGGDAAGNGWGRPISQASGMDYWIGSWVDGGNGAELYSYNGVSWDLNDATYNGPPDNEISIGTATNTATVTLPFANLGLSIGDSFLFDVFSSGGGGGDSAIDALSEASPSVLDWGDAYVSNSALSYTLVPEPATYAAVISAIALAFVMVRRRRR